MTGYIYLIKNKINGKIYIGQTIGSLSRRFAAHCNPNNGSNSAITKAIVKYGRKNFEMSTVDKIEDDNKWILIDKLNILERIYIQSYSSIIPYGYNTLIGGKNAPKPDHVRAKISKSLKGNKKLGHFLGKTFTQEHKEKLSASSKWSKKVICIENSQVYSSVTAAAKAISTPRTSLSKWLNTYGFYYKGNLTFKYQGK